MFVKIIHIAHDRSYATNEEGEPEYQNAFVAIPSKVPATPHRLTRRPSGAPHASLLHTPPNRAYKRWRL